MKKDIKVKAIWQIIESILLVTLGVLTMVFCRDTRYWKALGIILGSIVVLDGVQRVLLYYIYKGQDLYKYGLTVGAAELTIGIFIIANANLFITYIILIMIILILVIAGLLLLDTIMKLIRKEHNKISLITTIIIMVVMVAAGVLALIFYVPPEEIIKGQEVIGWNTISIILLMIGILYIVGGIVYAINTIKVAKQIGKENKVVKEVKVIEHKKK